MKNNVKHVMLLFAVLLSFFACRFADGQESSSASVFKPEELEQILAPVALYPDSLLSQVLMASTYPLEIVQAHRWYAKNNKLSGTELATELEKQTWDASVKSLVNFPQVLTMMSEKLDWTQKLGDAFLAQQKEVMDTVQNLRKKAQAEGNLESTKDQVVKVEQDTIVVEYADPEVVYVPSYNPTVVYGTWPYAANPPYSYYPPGYSSPAPWVTFTAGLAWGYAWGHCDWDNDDIDIDIDQNLDFNQNIDRDRYAERYRESGRLEGRQGNWQHNPENRKGVAYRDQATAQRFNRASSTDAIRSREEFRGRTEQGRRQFDGATRDIGTRDIGAPSDRARALDGISDGTRPSTSSYRSSSYSGRGGAFEGMDRGSSARNYSSRGSASRQSMSRPSGGGFGGSRGGASRGGGARGGGGRGGGRR